jgi:hypothetical protein
MKVDAFYVNCLNTAILDKPPYLQGLSTGNELSDERFEVPQSFREVEYQWVSEDRSPIIGQRGPDAS